MEIRFYTPELNLIGIMENQTSLLWTRKFYEPGSFQLITPITDYNVRLCQLGNIISIDGADEAAVIECVTIRQEHSRRIITAVGRMLSSYFDRRLIRPANTSDRPNAYKYKGTVEGAMRELITRLDAPIPLVRLGADNGFDDFVEFQATYKNLLSYLIKLSNQGNIGFKLIPDFTEKTLTFVTYKGKDHSIHQNERTRVEFSEEYQNISTLKYQEDDRNYKNTFYIGGEGQGNSRSFYILGYNDKVGLDRREVLYNANENAREFTMYVYNPPTFDQELPTEKLTNVPIYENDYNKPIYNSMLAVYQDNNRNNYLINYNYDKDQQWLDDRGISDYGLVDPKTYLPNPSSTPYHFSHFIYDIQSGIRGYEKRVTGYREETDAEFEARVARYYAAEKRWQERVAEYEENYQKDLFALEEKKNSIYRKHDMIINFEPVINPFGNYKYKESWDLGDIVTAKKESWGLEYDLRVTEVQEIYEHGIMMLAPTLGTVMPDTIDWEDR